MEYKLINKEDFVIQQFSSAYIGDDGAVVGDMVYSMDSFFEDVHFKREWMSMTQIAKKAMLINLSDAIAMNAKPLYSLISLSLPYNISNDDILELTSSFTKTAKEYGCEIIGGDTIASDKLHISITIISKTSNPLTRAGLMDGDILAYTGTLGESKRDLNRLFRGEKIEVNSRFYEPILRQEFVSKAREFLNAGMDISDGLFCDTNKLLDINKTKMELFEVISDEIGTSGEEYEMLIGFNSKNLDEIKRIAKETNTPLNVFAKISSDGISLECQNHHF
jgi:thiamine-monophosphate kinase